MIFPIFKIYPILGHPGGHLGVQKVMNSLSSQKYLLKAEMLNR